MKLNWQESLLYLATMGMEGCWLYALLSLINQRYAGERLSIIGILLIYPIAFVFSKLLKRGVLLNSIKWLVWLAIMLATVKIQLYSDLALTSPDWLLAVPMAIAGIFSNFKPELIILIAIAAIWWLGSRLARSKPTFAAAASEFQFGLVMLLLIFFITTHLDINIGSSVPIILTFFFFALIGTSIAHAREGTGWLSGLYHGHWSGLLLITIGLVLALGLLISAVVTPGLLQLAFAALTWIWELIMKALEFVLSLLPQVPVEIPEEAAATEEVSEMEEFFKIWTMPEWLSTVLRAAWLIVFCGLSLLAMWQLSSSIFGWLRRKLAGMGGAEFEPLPGAFRADFLSFFKRLALKLLGFRLRLRLGVKSSLPQEITSIRQIYRQLLRWAAAGGHPRLAPQTPQEYFYTLAGLLPTIQGELAFITGHYVKARYGPPVASQAELDKLKQSWQRVKQNDLMKLSQKE